MVISLRLLAVKAKGQTHRLYQFNSKKKKHISNIHVAIWQVGQWDDRSAAFLSLVSMRKGFILRYGGQWGMCPFLSCRDLPPDSLYYRWTSLKQSPVCNVRPASDIQVSSWSLTHSWPHSPQPTCETQHAAYLTVQMHNIPCPCM